MNTEIKRMIAVTVLCGLGFMMYSVDRMVLSSTILFIQDELALNSTVSGVLLSSFFYGFIAFLFISGVASDRYSSKYILIGGTLLFSVATILTGLSSGFYSLLLFRIITGIGEGFFWPAASVEVANATPDNYRTTVMSLYWSGYPIGSFFGVWLGSHIGAEYGWRMAFYIAGGLGIVLSVLYILFLDKKTSHQAERSKVENIFNELMKKPSVILMALYYLFILSGWWVMLLWAPTFLVKEKSLSPQTAGTIASLLGITGAIGGFLIGRVCDRFSFYVKKYILISVTIISGFLMAALIIDTSPAFVTVLILLLGFFGYPITPVVLSFTAELIEKSRRGAAIGFVTNMGMFAGAISPFMVGHYSETYEMKTVWLIASLVMGVSFIFLVPLKKITTN
ncbi:MFS transporter [Salmonella enterica subsp. enterica]|nr:MFS transporter [Salmonella enterica]EBY0806094.1 MFS transporter [Salmonella enterica subsp. enterica serovar Berlin]ECF3780003.1 MFS transporter [Salmonella enterica subsp. enterica serovar Oslo]EDR2104885.1 MFS transporter [Salmonella enterica subsp. enterica]EDW0612929.1 MFS transporter [Salmonella enterica subsp. enterica serovar Ball]EGZ4376745.1 MFS transporter [Salmonella enterica subsp. enterica serovar Lexington]